MRRLKAMIGVFLMAASAWGGAGPAGSPRPATAKAVAQQAKSDAEIEREIRARLAKSKISQDKFQVHVQGGVATLEGKTEVVQHKGVATRLAKSGGAVAVKNQIQISDAAREKAAQNLETGRRRAQIKRSEARTDARTGRSER
ncbi:MAG: BON domain-containing protein [Acidobacteriia bacterium]|nr:BON domain-containing protein [Terriglobia bacterium]